MHTLESLRELVQFNVWANRRVVESLKASQAESPKAMRALSHLLVTEREWLLRMRGKTDSTGDNFWPASALDECEALANETAAAYTDFVNELTEETVDNTATYKNSKGIEFTTSFRDILTHVLFHSMAPRGQVQMALRADGGEPLWGDYIIFVREKG